jgi:SAM-dependent methyltransferase
LTYDHAADWAAGPDRVYRKLAEAAVALLPDDLRGRLALDAGAGAGAASVALQARGARTLAMDLSAAMVRLAPGPSFVADINHIPLRTHTVAVCVSNLVLSHVGDPAAVLAELRRVTEPGGAVVATAFPDGPTHPVKRIADRLLDDSGYQPPPWYAGLKAGGETAAEALLREETGAIRVDVDISDLSPDELAGWRLGMAQVGDFLDGLPAADRDRLRSAVRAEVAALPAVPPIGLVVGIGRAD